MWTTVDVLVVGGGPAGLSAALLLGRSRHRVLVCSHGVFRNAASHAIHGLLTHEGQNPTDYRAAALTEIASYPTVEHRTAEVSRIERTPDGFSFTCADGSAGSARRVLLATGLADEMPSIPAIDRYYGVSVHHCLYCDGYEHRDQPLAAYGPPDKVVALAAMMTNWSRNVVACTDGRGAPSPDDMVRAAKLGVEVIDTPIARLEGDGANLVAIEFADGRRHRCGGLFFSIGCRQASALTEQLGCKRDEKGGIVVDPDTESTSVDGVHVAGDASRDCLMVAVAVGEGVKAGVAINRSLMREAGLL